MDFPEYVPSIDLRGYRDRLHARFVFLRGRGNPKTFAPRSGVYSGLRLRGGAYLFESLRAAGTKESRSGQVRRSGCDSGSSHKTSGEADER